MAKSPNTMRDPELLEAALEGLEAHKQRIEQQIRDVQAMLGKRGGRSVPAGENSNGLQKPKVAVQKRQLSEAARKRIAAAQKKRWAEYRKTERQKPE